MAYLKPPWLTANVFNRSRAEEVEGYWKRLPDGADHPISALTPAR